MSTGDLKGCLRKLDSLLRAVKYPRDVDYYGLSKGDPSAFLPIVDFTLTTFSPLLTAQLIAAEFELTGKTDLRFTDTVYKVLRDIFQYKPVLSKQQFLHCGFSQSKIAVICDIINLVLQRHKQLKKEKVRCICVHGVFSVSVKKGFDLDVADILMFLGKEGSSCLSSWGSENDWLLTSSLSHTSHTLVPAVEERISSMEASLESFATALEKLPTLGTRLESLPMALEKLLTLETRLESLPLALEKLSLLETRLVKLETHLEKGMTCGGPCKNQDLVTISKETWDNLLSRVVLLETKLELASVQVQIRYSLHNSVWSQIRYAPVCTLQYAPLCVVRGTVCPTLCSKRYSMPHSDDLKDRLERITSMMKNTSSLLKSLDVSI
ncbi:unnamed protein product [Lota lota]